MDEDGSTGERRASSEVLRSPADGDDGQLVIDGGKLKLVRETDGEIRTVSEFDVAELSEEEYVRPGEADGGRGSSIPATALGSAVLLSVLVFRLVSPGVISGTTYTAVFLGALLLVVVPTVSTDFAGR